MIDLGEVLRDISLNTMRMYAGEFGGGECLHAEDQGAYLSGRSVDNPTRPHQFEGDVATRGSEPDQERVVGRVVASPPHSHPLTGTGSDSASQSESPAERLDRSHQFDAEAALSVAGLEKHVSGQGSGRLLNQSSEVRPVPSQCEPGPRHQTSPGLTGLREPGGFGE